MPKEKDYKFEEAKKFMMQIMDRYNFFEYKIKDDGKKAFYPKRNIKEFIGKELKSRHKSITNSNLLQHFAGMKTYGYNNSSNKILQCLGIDLDPKDSTANNELIFTICMKRISEFLGKNIFWERSTSYKNIHGYLFFKKERIDTEGFNELIEKLEQILSDLCPELARVELLGRSVIYSTDRKGIVTKVKNQTPVKLPRDYHRIDEMLQIGTVEIDELWKMTDGYEIKKELKSGSGREPDLSCLSENNFIPYMRQLALSVWKKDIILQDRKVTFEDLLACLFVTYVQNTNNIKTSVRNANLVWNTLRNKDWIERSFNFSVWKVCRNILSENGLLDWSQHEYTPPESFDSTGEIQKGKCCIYSLTQEVLDQVSSVGGGSATALISMISKLKKTGENLTPVMKKGLFFVHKSNDDIPIWEQNVA